MTADRLVVRVSFEELEMRHAVWCERCLLPARDEIDLVILLDGRADHIATYHDCESCGDNGWGPQP